MKNANQMIVDVLAKLGTTEDHKCDIGAVLRQYAHELELQGQEVCPAFLYHRALNELKRLRTILSRELPEEVVGGDGIPDYGEDPFAQVDFVLAIRSILLPEEAEVALLMVDGYYDIEIKAMLGLPRREFERIRECVREKLIVEGYLG